MLPPLDSQICFECSIRDFNSLGSIEIPVSGPGHDLLIVKCFSMIHDPNAIDPNEAAIPREWSEKPTGMSGKLSCRSFIAPNLTLS